MTTALPRDHDTLGTLPPRVAPSRNLAIRSLRQHLASATAASGRLSQHLASATAASGRLSQHLASATAASGRLSQHLASATAAEALSTWKLPSAAFPEAIWPDQLWTLVCASHGRRGGRYGGAMLVEASAKAAVAARSPPAADELRSRQHGRGAGTNFSGLRMSVHRRALFESAAGGCRAEKPPPSLCPASTRAPKSRRRAFSRASEPSARAPRATQKRYARRRKPVSSVFA
jgi:hypothetical protein